jgi:excisionase family DNA binding protein
VSLLTTREVAEILGVSRTWVLRRVASGEMPGFRIGGDGPIRYDAEEVQTWARNIPKT